MNNNKNAQNLHRKSARHLGSNHSFLYSKDKEVCESTDTKLFMELPKLAYPEHDSFCTCIKFFSALLFWSILVTQNWIFRYYFCQIVRDFREFSSDFFPF